VPLDVEAVPVYRKLVQALLPYIDVFICETMSTGQEAVNAASAALEYGNGRPVYVAWTLAEAPGSGLRSGESVAAAYNKVAHLDLAGFLFNCTSPEAILAALRELRVMTDLPIGGYANRMNAVDSEWTLDNDIVTGRREDLDTQRFVAICKKFAEAGAAIIGGCCGISPLDIQALSKALANTD
jgi:S-methylmethionine-dependent homocysteine/selenocysteine methylase